MSTMQEWYHSKIGLAPELKRSLIAERVRASLRNARAKGKRLGRPRVTVDAARIAELRSSGASWREITDKLGVSKGTAQRAFYSLPKNLGQSPLSLSRSRVRV